MKPSRGVLPYGLAALVLLPTVAFAYIQDRAPLPPNLPVAWNLAGAQPNISAGRVLFVINENGSDDVPFSNLESAVTSAFTSWSLVNGSLLDFARDTGSSAAEPNLEDQVNVVFWDEDPRDRFRVFGMVEDVFVFTRLRVDAQTGQIADADIILNGYQFTWTTNASDSFTSASGPVDIQAAITTAVGELIGLKLVPTINSTLSQLSYPGDISTRQLFPDEQAAALDLYPPSPDPGLTSISGRVTKGGQPVFGAYVVAFANGLPQVGAIADANGDYSIRRITPGTYTLRVVTLPRSLEGFYGGVDNNFLSQEHPGDLLRVNFTTSTGETFSSYENIANVQYPSSSHGVAGNITLGWESGVTSRDRDNDAVSPDERYDSFSFASNAAGAERIFTIDLPDGTYSLRAVGGDSNFFQSNQRLSANGLTFWDGVNTQIGEFVDVTKTVDVTNEPLQIQLGGGSGAGNSLVNFILLHGDPTVVVNANDTLTGFDFAVTGASNADPWEPDNTDILAPTIPTDGTRQIHHSHTSADVDYAKFTATVGNVYLVETSNLGVGEVRSDTILELLDSSQVVLKASDDANPKQMISDVSSRIVFQASVSGAHFVRMAQALLEPGSGTAFDLAVTDITALLAATPAPTVSSVTPNTGFIEGGFQVAVTGGNFVEGASVLFGSVQADEVYVQDGGSLFATVPPTATPGPVIITVVNADGTPSASGQTFTYTDPITIGFSDATFSALGTFELGQNINAVAWPDYDDDGNLDLFYTTNLAAQLYANDGDETFTNVSGTSGILLGDTDQVESAAWGDYNRDGCIDVYKTHPEGLAFNTLLRNKCDGTFVDVTPTALVAGHLFRPTDASWVDVNQDGELDLYVAYDDNDTMEPNQLFMNMGNGIFQDRAGTFGLADVGRSVNVNWADYNNDGLSDLYLVRSGTDIDRLYKRDPFGGFTDVMASSGLTDIPEGTDAAWGDIENDGDLDLYVTGALGFHRLFRNNGDETFTDVTDVAFASNVNPDKSFIQCLPRAITMDDFDNDGLIDIYVACEFQASPLLFANDLLYHNTGNGTFFELFFNNPNDNGLSAAFGDFTGTGAPDIIVGSKSGSFFPLRLWRNHAARNDWVKIRLLGSLSNGLGIGARVSVTALVEDVLTTQTREVVGGSKGQNPLELHFGLGSTAVGTKRINELRVTWPSVGIVSTFERTQVFTNLAVNQTLTIVEGPPLVVVTLIQPNSGPSDEQTLVLISGMGFDADVEVKFGTTFGTVVAGSTSSGSFQAFAPLHSPGSVDVTVTNPSQVPGSPLREAVIADGFLYYDGPLVSLDVFDPVNTFLSWSSVGGQSTYDVIRGNIGSLTEIPSTEVRLGTVTCIENDSPDTSTAGGNEDSVQPASGQVFFYLARLQGAYGLSSSGLPRVPQAGDCTP